MFLLLPKFWEDDAFSGSTVESVSLGFTTTSDVNGVTNEYCEKNKYKLIKKMKKWNFVSKPNL